MLRLGQRLAAARCIRVSSLVVCVQGCGATLLIRDPVAYQQCACYGRYDDFSRRGKGGKGGRGKGFIKGDEDGGGKGGKGGDFAYDRYPDDGSYSMKGKGKGGNGKGFKGGESRGGRGGDFAFDNDRYPDDSSYSSMKGKGKGSSEKGGKGKGGGKGGGKGKGKGKGRGKGDGEVAVFVSNLPNSYDWMDLKDLFNEHFRVAHSNVATRPNGESRGFGVVKFFSLRDAEAAAGMIDEAVVDGRVLTAHVDRTIEGHGDNGWQARKRDKFGSDYGHEE